MVEDVAAEIMGGKATARTKGGYMRVFGYVFVLCVGVV
jgi:hypothetical protein